MPLSPEETGKLGHYREKCEWCAKGNERLKLIRGRSPLHQFIIEGNTDNYTTCTAPSYEDYVRELEQAADSQPQTAPAISQPPRCALCGSPAYFEENEGVWRHCDEVEANVIICDKYGYPIEVVGWQTAPSGEQVSGKDQ